MYARFRETFRQRSSEWFVSIAMLLWGFLVIVSPGTFTHHEFFIPMLTIASQAVWGLLAFMIGLVRVIFLIINGAWRPSAHIRAVGAVFGCLMWSGMTISAITLSWVTPTVVICILPLGLDLLSLWFSAGDAKLADIEAKRKIK